VSLEMKKTKLDQTTNNHQEHNHQGRVGFHAAALAVGGAINFDGC